MKPAKLGGDSALLNEIVNNLRSVPKTRLRIVRDIVGAFAESPPPDNDGAKLKRRGRASLLKTSFCGMWEGRSDIANGQSYGKILRGILETRGDRT
jgi:hypothetical protein